MSGYRRIVTVLIMNFLNKICHQFESLIEAKYGSGGFDFACEGNIHRLYIGYKNKRKFCLNPLLLFFYKTMTDFYI